MGQISANRPNDGDANWAPTADALLDALKNESNYQDTRITSLEQAIVQINTRLASGGL